MRSPTKEQSETHRVAVRWSARHSFCLSLLDLERPLGFEQRIDDERL
jgi:hypothetical protein